MTKKNYAAIAFQNFIENSNWRHFYGAVTGDMMSLEFQRIIERALALYAPIKACYIGKDKPSFCFKKWLCELNSEKARWNFIQDLRNKEKTQTRIHSLLNSFGNKITKPMEFANLLNYRFSTLGRVHRLTTNKRHSSLNCSENVFHIPIYNSQGNNDAHGFIEYQLTTRSSKNTSLGNKRC